MSRPLFPVSARIDCSVWEGNTAPIELILRAALMDCRPVEIRLTGYSSQHAGGAEVLIRELTALARRIYRSLGGQDVVATAEERGGMLVVVIRTIDDPPGE